MKSKLLLSIFIGVLFVGCSIDPIEEEITEGQINRVDSHYGDIEYSCAGPDNMMEMTESDASAIPDRNEVKRLYLSLLEEGVPRDGEFDPSILDLIYAFNDPSKETRLGDYTTIYTITFGDCTDSVELTIRVIPDFTDPIPCDLNGGADNMMEMTESDAAAIPDRNEVKKLYLSLLAEGVSRDGEFDPSIMDLIYAFNDPNRETRLGDYTTVYTITDGECTDSVELTIRVIADFKDPIPCDLNAGPDNMMEMAESDAAAIPDRNEVKKLYLSLLAEGVPRNGEFDPSIMDLIAAFNDPNRETRLGDYTTTYTITDGDCIDTVELTIRVIAD